MAGKYQAYAEYKRANAEWLGEIPSHWNVFRTKYVYKEVNERSRDGSETLLSVSEYFGVKPRQDNIDEGEYLTRAATLEGYKKCAVNDFVMNIMLAWKTGHGVTKYDGIVSPAYSVFRNTREISPDYFHYLLRTKLYTTEFKTKSTGVIDSRLRLYPESFGTVELIFPPVWEQMKITEFLDHETAKIERLIEKQQQLIELLKEKRQAVISHAVTKGLDPNVKMKDSEVEWLGEVPEKWSVIRSKYVCSIGTGDKDTEDNDPNAEYPFFVRSDNVERISTYSFDGEAVLTAGDGAGVAKVFHYFNGKFDFHQRVYKFSDFRGVKGKFFYFYISSHLHKEVLKLSAKSTVDSLRLPMLQNFFLCHPSVMDQERIVFYIEKQIEKYDHLIAKASESVALMVERRTALISAAVTGKIDVRNWQADTQTAA